MLFHKTSHKELMNELVAPRFGFIQGVYEIELEGDDPAIYTAFAKCANAGYYGNMFFPGEVENGGAGLTRSSAIASTIGESVERYCLALKPRDRSLLCAKDFPINSNPIPIKPTEIALFSPEQYRNPSFPFSPYTEDSLLNWTRITALDGGADIFYPSSLIYIPYISLPEEEIIAPAISTGAACGSTIEMVQMKGLNECIERDSIMLYWFSGISPVTLDPCRLPNFGKVFKRLFARPWLEYKLFILTNDFEVPVAFCILRDLSCLEINITVGGAASLCLEKAVEKSIIEAVQGRFWIKYMLKTQQLKRKYDNLNSIESFADHVCYYAQEDRWPDMIQFHNCKEISTQYLNKLLKEQPKSWQDEFIIIRDRIISSGNRIFYKDLTTDDIAKAGLVVGKVITPSFINLNALYEARFLGSKRFEIVSDLLQLKIRYPRSFGFNPLPHPYP
jgi:ribosomal protein S12 methylthiotransferase accessory factor